jgi:DNA helicase-4
MDVTAVTVTRALLWHTVEIRTRTRLDTLTGLTGDGARRLRDDLHGFVNLHLSDLIDRDKDRLKVVDDAVSGIVEAKRQYLAHSDISRSIAAVPGAASQALSHPLFDASRIPAGVRAHLPASFSMLIDPDERGRYNEIFVAHEMEALERFFDDLGGISLSDEQREACIRLEDSNLLVASAGSGKSATMVGKVAYVLEKAIHSPGEILVLAFNKKAVEELKERIAEQLGVAPDNLECRVTTFHALGFSIIKEVEGKPPQLANWVESASGETAFINKVIDELTATNVDFVKLWVDLLLFYPQADIPAAVVEGPGSPADYERYLAEASGKRGGEIPTLAGIFVKSLQEQRIANWLWLHSVDFAYERQMATRDEDGSVRHVHPDFYYAASRTVHEHFAINADGSSPFPNYVEHATLKRAGYARMGVDFFETTSAQADDDSLLDRLRSELESREIELIKRPLDEVLKAIPGPVRARYNKIVGVCIKHIRASGLTLDMLLEKAKSLHDRNRAERFAKAIWVITEAYSRKLEADQRIDYDSMIGDAVKLVETGRYRSPYSLILVDEFQDISDPRANLIKALKHQKPFTKVFAVGDDWQSIYRFAGSDITIFTQFEAHFGTAWQGRLERTYRCNQMLADTAARFIQKNPAQLTKTVRSSRAAIPKSIRAIPIRVERHKPSFRDACFRLLHRLDAFLDGNPEQWRQSEGHRLKVLVLWRYNVLDPFHGRTPTFDNIEVSGLSFHRSKGLEADYTILLDVTEGEYGVPSRIEDDELLDLVIPRPETFEYAEERRLFYVALTRASRGAFLLYDGSKPSRYIKELCDIAGDDVRFETIDGRRLRQCPICITGRLVEREGANRSAFLGCTGPACRYTEQVATSHEQSANSPSPELRTIVRRPTRA